MEHTMDSGKQNKQPATPTLRKGYRFYFTDNDDSIVAYGSALSGKEIVYLNGQVVSEIRSIRRSSEHHFSQNGINYRLRFTMTDLIRGTLECELYRDDELVSRQRQSWMDLASDSKGFTKAILFLLLCFAGGLLVGMGAARLALS